MEPDFKAFAKAWTAGDPRLKDLSPEQAESLAARLAEAMDRRRRQVQSEPAGGGDLIVSVPSDALSDSGGLNASAMAQLTQILEDHLKND